MLAFRLQVCVAVAASGLSTTTTTTTPRTTTRRHALLLLPLTTTTTTLTTTRAGAYVSSSFAFDVDESFVVSNKPVKTHLEEALVKGPKKRQVGVTVDRVKIQTLEEFGDVAFVADKVVSAERTRDGSLDAALVGAKKLTDQGVTYYQLEYTNVSERGDNHFLSKIAVRDGKLYVLTAQARVDDYDDARPALQRAVDSFRVTSS